MPFVSVTRLHLRSWRFFPWFMLYTIASARQAKKSPGFLGGYLAGDPDGGNWTVTLWRDEAAMKVFRTAGAHMRAMPKLLNWCDEASIAHWTQEPAIIPAADVAFDRMREQGRLSKVHQPSARQREGQLTGKTPPRVGIKLRG
jgi:hypothetical protein